MNILLDDFTAKVGREHVFKSAFRNESFFEISNDNWVRVVTSHNRTPDCQEYNVPLTLQHS
jgi:hypothetical protein